MVFVSKRLLLQYRHMIHFLCFDLIFCYLMHLLLLEVSFIDSLRYIYIYIFFFLHIQSCYWGIGQFYFFSSSLVCLVFIFLVLLHCLELSVQC